MACTVRTGKAKEIKIKEAHVITCASCFNLYEIIFQNQLVGLSSSITGG
jgi:hypothetical protein